MALGEIRGAIWRHFVIKLPSKNVNNYEQLRFRNSVRPDPTALGPIKLRTIFPHTSVLPKPPQLPYGAVSWFLQNMFGNLGVRYRGKNHKGVLDRPWTKWKVLRAISGTLTCQFTGKHENEKI